MRDLVTGDEDIDRDTFADDPFVNALIHVQGVGTRGLRATSELLDLR